MHRLPTTLAAVAFTDDTSPVLVSGTRKLDGHMTFVTTPIISHHESLLPKRLELPFDALLFVRSPPPGTRFDAAWPTPDINRTVALEVAGGHRPSLRSLLGIDRPIILSGRGTAASALVLAIGLTRLARSLRLPLLIDCALADLTHWLGPLIEQSPLVDVSWAPPTRPPTRRRYPAPRPQTAMAQAFERARTQSANKGS